MLSDILFMTASYDGTLKFWMVAKAGVTRKYIPNFDRAEVPIEKLYPEKETVICGGFNSR